MVGIDQRELLNMLKSCAHCGSDFESKTKKLTCSEICRTKKIQAEKAKWRTSNKQSVARSNRATTLRRRDAGKEAAYRLRTYRHKAYYSLDRDDGLEHEAVFVALSPHELYERKVTMQELHAAISSLPDKQAKRIYAHFILGMTKQDIARAEGVHEKVVRVAIERGLRRLEKILKNSL